MFLDLILHLLSYLRFKFLVYNQEERNNTTKFYVILTNSCYTSILFLRTSILGAEFFCIYDGDGNIVRSIEISGEKEYNYIYNEGSLIEAITYSIELNDEIVVGKSILNTLRYDAWGNILSVTGSLASTVGQANPFRYRSYYYDTDFAFHYSFLRHLLLDSGRNQRGKVKSVLHGFALFQSDYKVFDDTGGFLIRHGTDISHINVHIRIGNGGVYGIEANDTCRQDKNGANCDTYMP